MGWLAWSASSKVFTMGGRYPSGVHRHFGACARFYRAVECNTSSYTQYLHTRLTAHVPDKRNMLPLLVMRERSWC